MVWKIKDLKEFIEGKNDEDVVEFGHFCERRDNQIFFERFSLRARKPKRTEFEHCNCKFCEKISIKGTERLYCNRKEDLLDRWDWESCGQFEHKEYEVEFLE